MKYTKETTKQQIIDDIQKYNPALKENSLKQYSHRIQFFVNKHHDLDLDNPEEILQNINKVYDNLSTRKGLISPLAKITNSKLLLDEIQNLTSMIRTENEKNKATESEKLSWLNKSEINKIINTHIKKIKEFENSEHPTPYQKRVVKKFAIFLFFSGRYIPPRRVTDYSHLLWDPDGTNNYNYIDGNKIVFNRYKTTATYGQQIITLPKQLLKYINLHRKFNYSDSKSKYMFSSTEHPLAAISINSFLSDIIGKQINSNVFRKIYISDLFKNRTSLKEIKEKTALMGTSSGVALESYNKIDIDSLD